MDWLALVCRSTAHGRQRFWDVETDKKMEKHTKYLYKTQNDRKKKSFKTHSFVHQNTFKNACRHSVEFICVDFSVFSTKKRGKNQLKLVDVVDVKKVQQLLPFCIILLCLSHTNAQLTLVLLNFRPNHADAMKMVRQIARRASLVGVFSMAKPTIRVRNALHFVWNPFACTIWIA